MYFTVEAIISATPKVVFEHWLDGKKHTEMTGGLAQISSAVGDTFSAWNGYIQGKNILIVPHEKIVQSWRTSQFRDGQEDSKVILRFEPFGEEGSKLILRHENLTDDDFHYKQGWQEHYFMPMKQYFLGFLKNTNN